MLTAERNRLPSGCKFYRVKFQQKGNRKYVNVGPLIFFLWVESINSINLCLKVPHVHIFIAYD